MMLVYIYIYVHIDINIYIYIYIHILLYITIYVSNRHSEYTPPKQGTANDQQGVGIT